jgi:hypothetical protein
VDPGDKWMDRNSGPVVRPYALTGGRTEPADGEVLDLVAVVVAVDPPELAEGAVPVMVTPEHRKILGLCHNPATVADVASDMGLPLGVVRVLLADLLQNERLSVLPQRRAEDQPSATLLKEVLRGLRAL